MDEPSHVPVPFQYNDLFFNSQPEDNILSLTNNSSQSCGRYDPPSSYTGSLSMERGVEPYQQSASSTYDTSMSLIKRNASESSRSRQVSTQTPKQRKGSTQTRKQRKFPKALIGVASNISPRLFNLLTSLLAFTYVRSQV